MMVELWCSWTTAIAVPGAVGNDRRGGVQSEARVRAERERLCEEEQVNLASML
jgi:hypothetical protein